TDASGAHAPLTTVSDDSGRFAIEGVPPGRYDLKGTLEGFDAAIQQVQVAPASAVDVTLDLPLARVSQTVQVGERPLDVAATAARATERIEGSVLDQGPLQGDRYQALLPLLPGVVRGPDGRIR